MAMLKISRILKGAVEKRPPEPAIRAPEHTSDMENAVAMLQKEIAVRRKTEEDMRQLKEFNESIVQNMTEGIMLQDTQGNHTFVNPAAASLLGYTSEELKGSHWTEIVPPDQRSIIEAADKIRLKGASSRYGVELLSKAGRRIPVQISVSPLLKNGTLAGTIAVFTDISELKKAEEQRRRREAQNSLIYKASQNIGSKLDLQILLTEIVNTIRDAFNYYGVMLLLTEEDGRHLRMKTIAGGYAQIYPPNRLAVFGEGMIGFSASSGITQVSGDVSKDPHYLRWGVEKTKSELSVPIKSGDRVIGVLDIQSDEFAAFSETDVAAMETLTVQIAAAIENARLYEQAQREIVERRQAEEDLRRLKEFNEGIIQNMAEGIVVENAEGYHTFVNPAAASLLGYTAEELVGLHWTKIVPADQLPIVKAADKLRTQGGASRYEVEMMSKGGQRISVQISGSPIMNKGGFDGTIAVFTDISELKKAEEQRRRREAHNALIYKVGQNIGSKLDLQTLLTDIVNTIRDAFNYYGVMLLLTEEDGRHLGMKAIAGGYAQIYPPNRLAVFGEGMIGFSASSGITQVSGDVSKDPHYIQWNVEATKSELSVPIKSGDKVIGVLDLQSDEYAAFSETDVAAMETLATQIATAIENAKLYEQAQREIVERRQVEDELRRIKEFNEGIVQNMAEGIVVKNTEGCLTFLNPATVSLLGYTSEELLGRHWRMIFPPDQYPIIEAADKLREQGLASRYDVEMLSKDGRRLPVQISGSPVMKNGTFAGTIVVFTDISELKKAEEQRRRREAQNALIYKVGQNLGSELELEALLAEIVNSVHDAFNYYGVMLLLTDESGRYLKMKTIAGGYAQIYPKDHITVFGEGMIGYSASSGITQVSGDVEKNPQYVRWTEEKTKSELSVPIKIGDKVIGVLDIQSDEYDAFNETDVAAMETLATQIAAAIENAKLYDQAQQEIVERRQAEERLKKATEDLTRSNKELELFAYIASHDLQEPLRMIGSYVQLLARRYKGKLDADAEEFIGFAVDGATRMQRMINDLLTYSRVGTKGKPFVPTDLEKVLSHAESNLLVAVEESGAAITHDPLPAVTGDEIQLIQLFQNLIGNAVKFRLEGKPPAVHVSAGEKDDEWVLSIRDNGIGIGSQYFERIFQIFQRLHERSKYPGTGIGLAVCRRIVERHSGRIWVESEPGCGATFFFTIPKRRLAT